VSFRRGDQRPLVIGHRGAAAIAPENTLEGLAAAVDAGVDAVEFDVGSGLLLGHSLRERARQPPTLDDALALLAARGVRVHVDLKAIGIEEGVAAAVERHGLVGRTLVSTTSPLSLRRLADAAPGLTRAISYPRDRFHIGRVRWPGAVSAGSAAAARAAMPARVVLLLRISRGNALSLHHRLVSPAAVAAAHRRGAAVLAWTVNDPVQMERVAAAGVDAIVTDDPGKAFEVLARLNSL
jgi:glycerophosphoryl diester phosphodiesterase